MGWAEKRIQQYNQGQHASWMERRCLEHANLVHFVLACVSMFPLVGGLWFHNWWLIALAVLLNFFGHLYCWLQK